MWRPDPILKTIGEVETINQKLREENARLREQIASNAIRASGVLAKQAEELHEARARLARCVEAAERMLDVMDNASTDEWDTGELRAALAAAKGE